MKTEIIQSMSKYIVVIMTAMVLCVAVGVYAQEATTSRGVSTDRSQMSGMTAEEHAAMRDDRREERRAMLMNNVQDRIINLASNVTKRLEAGIARMGNIIGRLETRIEKLKTQGVDTRAAEVKLGDAKLAHSAAQSALGNLPSVTDAVRGDTPREAYVEIRTQFMNVRDLLKQTHGLLIETVALLKEAIHNADIGQGVSGAVTDQITGNTGSSTSETGN